MLLRRYKRFNLVLYVTIKKILKQQNTHSETPISVMKRRLITAVVTPLGTFVEQTLEAFRYTTTGSGQDLVVGGINGWSQHNPITIASPA